MENVFPNAAEARQGARNNTLIYGEIRAIEAAILTAIDDGDLGIDVTGTVMTGTDATGQAYTAVWQGDTDQAEYRTYYEQMSIVIQYFADMGYTIRRMLITESSSMKWEVLW